MLCRTVRIQRNDQAGLLSTPGAPDRSDLHHVLQLFIQRHRRSNAVALTVVDADAGKLGADRLAFYKLCNSLETKRMTHLVDRGNHGIRDRIFYDLAHELAIDFQVING